MTGVRVPARAELPAPAAVVCDYIAGMTDRYAREEHLRLTDLSVSG